MQHRPTPRPTSRTLRRLATVVLTSGLVLASMLYSLPFVVQPLQAAFEAVGRGPLEAAAVLGAATLTRASSDRALGQLVTPRLAQPGVSIGVAVQDAKATLATTQPDMADVLLGWTLLGDPALVVTP